MWISVGGVWAVTSPHWHVVYCDLIAHGLLCFVIWKETGCIYKNEQHETRRFDTSDIHPFL
jgi:hypothetical protein